MESDNFQSGLEII